MQLNKTVLMWCVAAALVCGCKNKDATPDAAQEVAQEAVVNPAQIEDDTDVADAKPDDGIDGDQGQITETQAIQFAVAMTAATEACGLAKPAEVTAALQKFKAETLKQGGSPVDVDRVYSASLADIKAKGAADPAGMKRQCADMRKLGDPAEAKKMEDAAKALEKLAKELEAKHKG